MKIIAFTGALESGKSTAALGAVSRILNMGKGKKEVVACVAFADPMKHICEEYFGFEEENLYTPDGKRKINPVWNITGREFLQKFGQGMRDIIDPNFWVKLMEIKIENLSKDEENNYAAILIDDLRMVNEAEMVHKHGGIVIHVERPEHNPVFKGIENHPSEVKLPASLIDYMIVNDGTVDDLYKKVNSIIDQIFC